MASFSVDSYGYSPTVSASTGRRSQRKGGPAQFGSMLQERLGFAPGRLAAEPVWTCQIGAVPRPAPHEHACFRHGKARQGTTVAAATATDVIHRSQDPQSAPLLTCSLQNAPSRALCCNEHNRNYMLLTTFNLPSTTAWESF